MTTEYMLYTKQVQLKQKEKNYRKWDILQVNQIKKIEEEHDITEVSTFDSSWGETWPKLTKKSIKDTMAGHKQ